MAWILRFVIKVKTAVTPQSNVNNVYACTSIVYYTHSGKSGKEALSSSSRNYRPLELYMRDENLLKLQSLRCPRRVSFASCIASFGSEHRRSWTFNKSVGKCVPSKSQGYLCAAKLHKLWHSRTNLSHRGGLLLAVHSLWLIWLANALEATLGFWSLRWQHSSWLTDSDDISYNVGRLQIYVVMTKAERTNIKDSSRPRLQKFVSLIYSDKIRLEDEKENKNCLMRS